MRATKVTLGVGASVLILLLLVRICATGTPDWPDETEEQYSFEKDMANDELTIADYSNFYSQYGKWLKPDTNPVSRLTGQGTRVLEENILTSSDEGHAHHRQKRQVTSSPETTEIIYSGDDNPCTSSPCTQPHQICKQNWTLLMDHYCDCDYGYEDVNRTGMGCTEIPASHRMYLTTTLNIPFKNEWLNQSSDSFLELQRDCNDSLELNVRNFRYFRTIEFREGGANETVVVYALYFNTSVDNDTLLNVAEEVLRMEKDGRIVIAGNMYNITQYTGIFLTFNATFSGTDDVDWCSQPLLNSCAANNGSSNRICVDGGLRYRCQCLSGFEDIAGQCTVPSVCPNNTYGTNCSQCQCNVTNTVSCDNVTGNCTCNQGWTGATCDTDIDECITNALTCSDPHETCSNIAGGYTCVCDDGYERDSYNTCKELKKIPVRMTLPANVNFSAEELNNRSSPAFQAVSDELVPQLWLSLGPAAEQVQSITITRISKGSIIVEFEIIMKNLTYSEDASVVYNAVSKFSEATFNISGQACQASNFSVNDTEVHNPCDVFNALQYCSSNKFCQVLNRIPTCIQCPCNATNTALCDSVTGNCTCNPGWTGATCDADIDECLTPICSGPYKMCTNTMGTYTCFCEDGYYLNASNFCQECTNNFYGFNCSSQCLCDVTNTVSYDHVTGNCSCKQGWTGATCEVDVDECIATASICNGPHEVCNNTLGGHDCLCVDGYQKNGTNTCTACTTGTFGKDCSSICTCVTHNTDNCNNVDGTCTCSNGWNGTRCEQDIDECAQNPPPSCVANSTCSNTNGTYLCVCNAGFFSLLDGSCTACTGNTYGANCSGQCQCNFTNTVSCDHVTGECHCKKGWDGVTCNVPDLCSNVTNMCMAENERCNNTENGPECVCEDGYHYNTSGVCVECTNNTYGSNCSSQCLCDVTNTVSCHHVTGNCTCEQEWTGATCDVDVDECIANASICNGPHEVCNNTLGGHDCLCVDGYQKNGTNTCTACTTGTFGKDCSSICTCVTHNTDNCSNVDGTCTCSNGWNGTRCEQDIDECAQNPPPSCVANSTCTNTNGTYLCVCNAGFFSLLDASCTACTWNTFGANCSGQCQCNFTNTVSCDHVTGECHCKKGWDGVTCDVPDLCSNVTNMCMAENERCNNTENGPECVCEDGYHYNTSGVCVECSNNTYGVNCSSLCLCDVTNTVSCHHVTGNCTCEQEWTGATCDVDVDECIANASICNGPHEVCNNTLGGHDCLCVDGYQKNGTNTCTACTTGTFGKDCSSICTCVTHNTDNCSNVDGTCTCSNGWNGTRCEQDIDECAQNPPPSCVANSTCTNTNGTFLCVCNAGFFSLLDASCTACTWNSYGTNCSGQCQCNFTNTVSCDHVTGECHCKKGWDGVTCDVPDLCSNVTNMCMAENERCNNTENGPECVCEDGYHYNTSGVCVECSNNTYGTNCSSLCLCDVTNTVSCHHVTGNCTCEQEWTGATCEVDVDECIANASICNGPHEVCNNTLGGHDCLCVDGFQKNGTNTCTACTTGTFGKHCSSICTCVTHNTDNCNNVDGTCTCSNGWNGTRCEQDIDECAQNPPPSCVANSTCSNTNGTYLCVCNDGFFSLLDGSCTACTGNTYGANCSGQCQCNFTNTVSCDHVTGECHCKKGWDGVTCDVPDLCSNVTNMCMAENERCNNTENGPECVCEDGYHYNTSGVCVECSNNTYGSNCSSHCLCDVTNTVSCHHVTGNCTCEQEWTGATCDVDVDECIANASICNGPHEVCNNTLGGHDCLCVDGYQKNGTNTCTACTTGTFGKDCSSFCTCVTHNTDNCSNVDGTCTCSNGWNGTRCEQDIDECAQNPPPSCVANSTCSNTNGTYLCVCNAGFFSLLDGSCTACTGNSYGTNCSGQCQCNFTNTVSCDHVTGECHCKKGWDGVTCDVPDLCSNVTNMCMAENERCNNTENGPECVCEDGYHYNTSGVCVECSNNTYGSNCSSHCLCDVTNTVSCHHVTGNCTCEQEWTGATCEVDVDECIANASICNGPHEVCNNTLGGHDCLCIDGYQKNGTNTCTACTTGTFGKDCSSVCTCVIHNTDNCSNVDGTCTCSNGWNGTRCEQDIDECAQNPPPSCVANSTCSNTNGTYLCVCNAGFFSLLDASCTACTGNTFGANCSGQCQCNFTNTVSCDHVTGECHCKKGWDGVTCDVQDLCSNVTNMCMAENERCNNTENGPECVCEDGYHYNTSGVCVECSNNTYGSNCSSHCLCDVTNTVSCHHVTGNCTCEQEWTGATCDVDVDECIANASICNGPHEVCNNTLGGHDCLCVDGYQKNGTNTCTACTTGTFGKDCSSICTCVTHNTDNCNNVNGTCTCSNGWNGTRCEQDIDECAQTPPPSCVANSTCSNTNGTYLCVCNAGFFSLLDGSCTACTGNTFGANCSGQCQCNFTNTVSCDHVTGKCHCKKGWDGVTCDIHDVCSNLTLNCTGEKERCNNTENGPECVCEDGYRYNTSGVCVACLAGTYGQNCSSLCTCITHNTVNCSNVDGTCMCQRGWTGVNCSQDINECTQSPPPSCVANSTCSNTIPGYLCVCDPGYQSHLDGTCRECSNNTYGSNCSRNCQCNVTNAVSCDHVTGNCSCKQGWTGATCDVDVDECIANASICNGPHEVCNNTLGGHDCLCVDGYQKNGTNTCTACTTGTFGKDCSSVCTCVIHNTDNCNNVNGTCTCSNGWNGTRCEQDIDECAQNPPPSCVANSTCTNTNGTYLCVCNAGFFSLLDGSCTACTGNSFGANCSGQCQCNFTNTVSCDHVTGECHCKKGWDGVTCDIHDVCSRLTLNCTGENERCNNTENGPECVCEDGYHYNTSGVCVACLAGTYGQNCSSICTCITHNTVNCSNVDGTCTCQSGWTGVNCSQDIDECTQSPPPFCVAYSTCSNTNGGYLCVCNPGYQSHSDGTCKECSNNTYGFNCSSHCLCDVTNTVSCDHVTGNCTCEQEWTGATCDVDVDECIANASICNGPHEVCNNTLGGHDCLCVDGFKKNGTNTCTACAWGYSGKDCSSPCTCVTENTDNCDNVNGTCRCKNGWSGIRCEVDIDECAQSTQCFANSTCSNTNGSYLCICDQGYQTLPIGNCSKCTGNTYGFNCSSQCQCNFTNTVSCHHVTGNCTCKQGWTGTACTVDIDECSTNSSTCSGQQEVCTNTLGGYVCGCADGYKKNASNLCDVCATGFFGKNCSSICTCATQNTVNCSNLDGACACKSGWRGKNCSEDVDECAQNPSLCVANSTCYNTVGSYRCVCNPGYKTLSDGSCTECTSNTYGTNCSSPCQCNVTNTVSCHPVTGNCTCKQGWSGSTCNTDIDECSLNTHNCTRLQEMCTNTLGGYRCTCNNGYQYNASMICTACSIGFFGKNCSSACTCITQNTVNCSNVDGSCTCKNGWTGANCSEDVNECTRTSSPCGANSTCYNTVGSYQCVCNTGYKTLSDGRCTVCTNNTYGTNCSSRCLCNLATTVSCDPVRGTCSCMSGWTGATCDADADECSAIVSPCTGANEVCQNTDGGYTCLCKAGYYRDAASRCSEIPEDRRVYLTTPVGTSYSMVYTNTAPAFLSSCDTAFTNVFKNVRNFNFLKTLELRSGISGQTVVVYVIYFTTTVTDSILQGVALTVLGMERAGYLAIGTTTYQIALYTGIFLSSSQTSNSADDFNWCSDVALYSCTGETSRCVDGGLRYTCNCKLGSVSFNGQCIDEKEIQYDMYPYGSSSGDLPLPEGDDETFRIEVNSGIPYGDRAYYYFYIGINGLITFEDRISGLNVKLDSYIKMFSAYQADIITRNGNGYIWYQIYSRRNQQKNVFEKAEREVTEFLDVSKFKAKLVIVITWDRVSHYSNQYTFNNRVTFQTILISDGEMSYALVYYKNDSMLWDPRVTTRVVMGYSDGKSRANSVKQSPYSNTQLAITGIGTLKGNTKRRGMWAYKVGEKYSPDQICNDWYETNYGQRYRYTYLDDVLPRCPCSIYQLGWLWSYNRHIPELNAFCYTMDYSIGWRYYPYGRECCYSYGGWDQWTWVQGLPYAGGVLAYNPIYYENLQLNKEHDRDPHDFCCGPSSTITSCMKYYELRPVGWCTPFTPFFTAFFYGDPHILTLDGKEYTFNGWGEYHMLKIQTENVTFNLQCRTDRVLTENGTQTDATIFSAFAMAENGVRVFVQLDPNDNQSLVIYANGSDQSRGFQEQVNFTMQTTAFSLRKNNTSLAISFGNSGIGITITPTIKALDISVNMPVAFRNQTKGLLGNYNNDPSDDFTLPNGTVLPSNISDREKFEHFGIHWTISPNESLFMYDNRLGPANYSHPEFEPIFLDEADAKRLNESYKACGGADKLACVYDYLVTGNKQVAETSKQVQSKAADTITANKNTVPELNSTGSLNVTATVLVTFQLIGEDKDSDVITYHVAEGSKGNVSINSTTGTVTYTPSIAQPASLGFYVVDSKKAASPVVVVPVAYCTGCSDNGVCDFNNLKNGSTQTFQIASCVCRVAWTGEECDQDRDACLENPCVSGQNCTDLTPYQQGESLIGYNCSHCPRGYEVNITTNKCQDVDECFTTNMCGQICSNTEGSYLCSCHQGYRLFDDRFSCLDINECAEKTDGCTQICTNYPGGFNCSCHPGYIYQELNKTCIQDTHTAATCSSLNCTQGCQMMNENPECFCLQGYVLSGDNKTCDDMDECTQGVCSQECNNTVGSFTCMCYVGFQLDSDKTTCNKCPDMYYGVDCRQVCNCNGRNTGCDNVKGCICDIGWTGTFCEADRNECVETPNICNNTREVCVNTNGSYRCDCQSGYTRGSDPLCIDINECAPLSGLSNCTILEDCVNTNGSYYCTCKSGYQKENEYSNCTDINECGSSSSLCEQQCVNTPGSYNCKCNYGYRLATDRERCVQVENLCKDVEGLSCEQGCTLSDTDKAICFCRIGFQLSPDGQKCPDIDECVNNNGGCSHTCSNTQGSFQCSCPIGHRMDNDRKTCLVCGAGTYGENCSNDCACGPGADRCDSISGCVCNSGYTGSKCDQDVDECHILSIVEDCESKNAHCTNFMGSYSCDCESGYQKNANGTCEDIDECLATPCSQMCENFAGGYRCRCNRGFSINQNGTCQDEDECSMSTTNRCQQQCINTIGSYRCYCNQTGYELDNDGYTCTARIFCHENTTCPSQNGGCSIVNGTDTCFCNSGYDYNKTVNTCSEQVRNWCALAGCQQNCTEITELPRFRCHCRDGYLLNDDLKSCRECTIGTFGANCSSTCTCATHNTVNCSNVDGNCTCKNGWKGRNCDEDIDECTVLPPSFCGSNSKCLNTNGSFLCVCEAGYQRLADGTCAECTGNRYGENCGSQCLCNVSNTVSCHHVNGNCTCKAGWTDYNCSSDIDECMLQTHDCTGLQETCSNTPGGYSCVCNDGYQYNGSMVCVQCVTGKYGKSCSSSCQCVTQNSDSCNNVNGTCTCKSGWNGTNCEQDINECEQHPAPCVANSTCYNTNGSYLCVCNPGYQKLLDGNCTECVNGTYGTNCSGQCQCNVTNTVSCDRVTGNCTCKQGWTGSTCDTEVDECTSNTHNCTGLHETCSNTVGGYDCLCADGYHYNASMACQACTGNSYGANCSGQCQCNFTNTVSCDHVTGKCNCSKGWTGVTCNIKDLCSNLTHNCTGEKERCNNTENGPECVCEDGYHYNTSGVCVECAPRTYGPNCSLTCTCITQNTASCSNFNGTCTCKNGWKGTRCEQDIDECTHSPPPCVANSTCFNTNGSYHCVCNTGYLTLPDGNCTECTNNTYGTNCSSRCQCNVTNTVSCHHVTGNCTCKQGWTNATCNTDINECLANSTCSGQHKVCTNTLGGYVCECVDGYQMNASNDCNVCVSGTFGKNCSSKCTCVTQNTANCNNVNGTCTCKSGWNGRNCEQDIDECAQSPPPCVANSTCSNTNGSYLCVCNTGYQNHSDGNCTECTNNTYGTQCSNQCRCDIANTVSCHHVTGNCTCKQGWTESTCNTDIDECVTKTHNCSGQNEMCNNTVGGFDCVCVDGYQRSASGICIEMTKVNLTMTLPVNVSYTQQELDNTSSPAFTDLSNEIIKELWKNIKSVQHKIRKILITSIRLGSVTFEVLVIIDDVSDEQAVNQVAPALQNLAQSNFTIYNQTTEVSYYVLNVIEGPNERCNSTGDTIECMCEDGYQYNASRVCVACANRTFGKNCSSNCTCITHNTVNCSNVDGTCTCQSGWTGVTCSQDINECTQSPPPSCVANSTCSNTNGSYLCVCNPGYQKHADGNCTECVNNTYGTNCSSPCQCNVTNTVSCHHVTGNCTCKQGWTGPNCDNDLDECASSNTHNCNGAHQTCNNTVGGFTCVCTDGYHYNTSTVCEACAAGTFGKNCSSTCTCVTHNTDTCNNLNGTCTCKSGWNGTNCEQDINECEQHPPPCVANSTCSNTNGSYQCACNPGFKTLADGNCTACSAGTFGVNCTSNCTCITHNTANCSNVNGTCTCNSGWNGANCSQDINECTQSPPPSCVANSTCSNTNGGYQCVCNTGYQTLLDGNCTACTGNSYGANCSGQCQCNFTNTVSCDHVTGKCNCSKGWDGVTCNIKDLCSNLTLNCTGENERCNNTENGPECVCEDGYHYNTSGVCVECSAGTYGENCSSTCTCITYNTVNCSKVDGTCTCQSGWTGLNCSQDIDECTQSPPPSCVANSTCSNTNGSYLCVCNPGYQKHADGSCTECVNNTYGTNCSSPCPCNVTNTVSCHHVTGNCTCKQGWTGPNCDNDLDECASSNTHNCTGAHQTCSNTVGGFTCVCTDGYHYNTSTVCEACAAGTFGKNCSSTCTCVTHNTDTCNNLNGICTCKSGWNGTNCEQDINECEQHPPPSCVANSTCSNTNGSYQCACNTGFKTLADGNCTACSAGTFGKNCTSNCTCITHNTANCSNVDGTCTCNSGWNGANCSQDIDECTQSPPPSCVANSTCSNTNGGYQCVCNTGYQTLLDGNCTACTGNTFGANCSRQCKCNFTNTVSCDHVTGTCNCSKGWDGVTCNIKDLCSNLTLNCTGENERCNNTENGPQCVCEDGYHYNTSGVCVECMTGTYGENCSLTCTCITHNTVNCSKVDGTCTCQSEWTGADCSQDINECTIRSSSPCVANSTCHNTNGSYLCVCNTGYQKHADGNCTECVNNTYGTNCSSPCPCNVTNTVSCHHVTGNCTCKQGWTGPNCDNDLDECASSNTHNCTGAHQTCSNTVGGFTCVCTDGYHYNTSTVCEDINECATHNCSDKNEMCYNTAGSYDCLCADGYQRSSSSICIEVTKVTIEMTLNVSVSDMYSQTELDNVSSPAFKNLSEVIATELWRHLNFTSYIQSITITSIRLGSVYFTAEIKITNGSDSQTKNITATALQILYKAVLTIYNQTSKAYNFTVNNVTITNVCDLKNTLGVCGSGHVCEISNGEANCKPVQTDTPSTNYELVIGLAVGIPLFFIAAFAIAVLVYIRIKRRARHGGYFMDDSQSDFSKIFGRLPLYGTPRPLSYRPDSYFDSGDDDSKHHYNATMDSNITSPWATGKLKGTRGLDVQEPASFSWDHFYQNVPEGEFHIKRARVSVVPTPTYQISSPESQEFDA